MRGGILLSTLVHLAALLAAIFGLPALVEPRGLDQAVPVELVVLEVPGPDSQPGPPAAGDTGSGLAPQEQQDAKLQPEPLPAPSVEQGVAEEVPVVAPQPEPAPAPEAAAEATEPSDDASADQALPSEPLAETAKPLVDPPVAVAPPPREEKLEAIAALPPPADPGPKAEPEKQAEPAAPVPPAPVPARRLKLPDFVVQAIEDPPPKLAPPVQAEAELEPPETAPELPKTAPLPDPGVETSSVQAAARAGAGSAGPTGAPEAQGEGGGSVSTGHPAALADYAAQLRVWLERHKRYPRRAKLRGQEGTVLLRFVLLRDGSVSDYAIAKGSGYLLLDEEVKALIRRAQPLPPMPGDLAESRMEFLVPFEFSLAEAGLR
ncbi:MAG: energy transducer TonB [Kiloniellales bacterium]